MKKKKIKKRMGTLLSVFGVLACLFLCPLKAEAAVDVSSLVTNRNAPFVSHTPDGFAWTIHEPLSSDKTTFNPNENYSFWYNKGTRVNTGVELSLPVAGVGQHEYPYEREGVVPVNRWEVIWREGRCIHNPGMAGWHGLYGNENNCYKVYYSGWQGFCADCNGQLGVYMIYASKDTIQKLQGVDKSMGYLYQCPSEDCGHIEQAIEPSPHMCKGVTYNQYRIVYEYNSVTEATGNVNPTYHMYNNATEYMGEPAYHCTKYLSDNTHGFTMKGYKVIGWDKEPGDPYGTPDYAIGDEIHNLTTDDWNLGEEDGSGKGTITLYAVWGKVGAELTVMPGTAAEIAKGAVYNDSGATGATYNASTKSTTVEVPYMGNYTLNNSKLTAPTLGTVTFDTQGGGKISPITVKKTFKAWEKTVPFYGIYNESLNKYAYASLDDGRKDTLTATWTSTSIILPQANKSDNVFGGWYKDKECTIPVGSGGEEFTPDENITLYAKWSKLTLKSVTDLTVDGWKGGVDLSWNQLDSRPKFYKIYQQKEGTTQWKQIFSANDIGGGSGWSGDKIEKSTPGSYSLTIPSTGFYNVTSYGAQGSDYGSYKGGLGGYVSGKFWLTKGDVLTYTVGSRTQGGGGNVGGNGAAGGGATIVKSQKLGTLLIGGGGGGANFYQQGGNGGLFTGTLSGTTEGAGGCGGGGDGYRGGGGGYVNYHVHTTGCYHYHAGNTTYGGACYSLAGCGGTYVWTQKGNQNGTYTNYPHYENPSYADNWDYAKDVCRQCALKPCVGGHPKYGPDIYTCNVCGKTKEGSGGSCNVAGYKLSCGKTQGQVVCGMTTDTVVSASPACGGASYINSVAVQKSEFPGLRSGNGYFKIEVDIIGCFDSMALADVSAHDEAKPNKVDESTVKIEAAEGTNLKVSFERPDDNGTVYYHYAESYLVSDRNNILSTTIASPTYNKITEGVYSYYYILNTSETTTVTASNKQTTSTTPAVKVAVSTSTVQYLHIAPVDRAGNVGDTIHVKIEPTEVEWNIVTEQIGISDTVNGTDYNSVYASGTNTYYVRSDGRTPFELKYKSYVQGMADDDYQIDHQQFEVATPGMNKEVFETVLPLSDASVAGTVVLDGSLFERSVYGSDVLRDVGYSAANRQSKAVINNFTQAFVGNPSQSGKTITVVPHAGAGYVNADEQNDVKWSDSTADASNKITLILDGEGPVIAGLELLENRELIDKNAGDLQINVTAIDTLSGVKEFYIKIANGDNYMSETYYPREDGSIHIELTADTPIFGGDFRVTAYAVDNVGNENKQSFTTLEFGLSTELTRILSPHEPLFSCGESGILTITTYGYADRVEVTFPAEFTAMNPELNCVFDYTMFPKYKQEEIIQFMVPLGTTAASEYTVTVRAYKGEKQLEDYPAFSLLAVEGSVLDELRTRLR